MGGRGEKESIFAEIHRKIVGVVMGQEGRSLCCER